MSKTFQKIGLFAKHNSTAIVDTFERLLSFLHKRGHTLFIEAKSGALLKPHPFAIVTREELGKGCDLVIVVGGDGSFINAARAVVPYKVPMLGVNRGRLGFLADILPEDLEKELGPILDGVYMSEKRTLIEGTIERNNRVITKSTALNDIVLYCGSIARMIEFEVAIDDSFVLRQRSDGLIAATPTGSTAYALSGGGPILYPTLNTFVLVPMLPHTLSSRPIVVDSKSKIELMITPNNDVLPKVSFDGQLHVDLMPGDSILLQKYEYELTLIHPAQHDYFSVLRQKLGWSTSQIKD